MREVPITSLFPATLVARRAFYALGRKTVYTNNYKNCHTVKAYSTQSDARDAEIALSIVKMMKESGYNVSTHMTEKPSGRYSKYGRGKGAIIIRIAK